MEKDQKPWPWWPRFHDFSKFKILITLQDFNLRFKHCTKLLIWNMLFHLIEFDFL
jgi:hypothetical protein